VAPHPVSNFLLQGGPAFKAMLARKRLLRLAEGRCATEVGEDGAEACDGIVIACRDGSAQTLRLLAQRLDVRMSEA
jgi:hypothetical protein